MPQWRHSNKDFWKGTMKFKETQIITLTNQKGGCGKTTSAISIAAAFRELGYKVAIVDCDPQCNTTTSFGVNPEELFLKNRLSLLDAFLNKRTAADIKIEFPVERFDDRLSLLPGNKQIGEVGTHLEMEAFMATRFNRPEIDQDAIKDEQRSRLKQSLASLRGIYDVVLIDTPPNLGFLMTSALVAADWFIIPVFASEYDLVGLEDLTVTINKIRQKYNSGLQLAGVLQGNFDKRTNLDRQVNAMLKKKFTPEAVFETVISRSVKLREMTFSHQTVFEFPDTKQLADDYLSLAKEMINRAMRGKELLKPLPNLEHVIEHARSSKIDMGNLGQEFSKEVSNG
jgi:chromosome partitioning protein